MNRPTHDAAAEDGYLALHRIFRRMPEELAQSVVAGCLNHRSDALNDAIDDSGIRVNGFRDASKAPASQLIQPVLDHAADGDDRLASALLRTWTDSQAELREAVEAVLRAEGLPPEEPDYKGKRFRAEWDYEQWLQVHEAVLKDRDDLDQNEATLMLSLASGRMPPTDEPIQSPMFCEWLEKLSELPFDAPEWDEANAFANEVERLFEENLIEQVTGFLEELHSDLQRLQTNFEDELRYLAIDLSGVMEAVVEEDLLDEARALIAGLSAELEDYKPIRPQAPVREEEETRARQRALRERDLLDLASKWKEARAAAAEAAANAPEQEEDGTPTPPDEQSATPEEVAKLAAERDQAQRRADSLADEANRLREASSGFELEKTQLREQISELKRGLRQAEETAQHWREAHVAERLRTDDSAETPQAPANVLEAIEQAEAAFPKELTFALNSKSHRRAPFQRPGDVFKALEWLAMEFRHMMSRPEAGRDFDKSLKERCSGWFYAANQSERTKGQNREWYQTIAGGKTWELSRHIGTGASGDPQNIIRIAFAWDAALRCVVVGYIGPHQRNSQS